MYRLLYVFDKLLTTKGAWDDINGTLPRKQSDRAEQPAQQAHEDAEWEAAEDSMSEKEVVKAVSGLKVEDPADSRVMPVESSPNHHEDGIL